MSELHDLVVVGFQLLTAGGEVIDHRPKEVVERESKGPRDTRLLPTYGLTGSGRSLHRGSQTFSAICNPRLVREKHMAQ